MMQLEGTAGQVLMDSTDENVVGIDVGSWSVHNPVSILVMLFCRLKRNVSNLGAHRIDATFVAICG